MNPQQKALLTAAWEALGPERVGIPGITASWPSPRTESRVCWRVS